MKVIVRTLALLMFAANLPIANAAISSDDMVSVPETSVQDADAQAEADDVIADGAIIQIEILGKNDIQLTPDQKAELQTNGFTRDNTDDFASNSKHIRVRHHGRILRAQVHARRNRINAALGIDVHAAYAGETFTTRASYYGGGGKTATGAHYNQYGMTAASKTLPFGTKLRVTYGRNSVIVTVNDRGPFVAGRGLDLSVGAARAVGLTRAGVGRVTAVVL